MHDFFQDFAQVRSYRNWSKVIAVSFTTFFCGSVQPWQFLGFQGISLVQT